MSQLFSNSFIKIVEKVTLRVKSVSLIGSSLGLPLVGFVKAAGHPSHLFLLLRRTGKFWNTILDG